MVPFKLGYSLREAFQHFGRSLSTSVGAVITIFLSLFIIGLFLIGGLMVESAVGGVEDKILIQAFVSDDAEQADIDATKALMEADPNVSVVSFKDKDQALAEYRERMTSKNASDAIAQLDGANPIPASLVVELVDPQGVDAVADKLKASEEFARIADTQADPSASVQYGQDAVEKLFQLTTYVRIIGIGLVVLLTFIALVFINNTIRLSILARRREIGIMRLVGASNSFIRGPFLMEGIIQALLGGVLTIGSLELVRRIVIPRIQDSIQFLTFAIPSDDYLGIYGLLLAVGLVIGLVGSALAMRRYLKV